MHSLTFVSTLSRGLFVKQLLCLPCLQLGLKLDQFINPLDNLRVVNRHMVRLPHLPFL